MNAGTSTSLSLFWHLSSVDKGDRIDASVKLVSALQQFQEKFVAGGGLQDAETLDENDGEDENQEKEGGKKEGLVNDDDAYEAHSSKLDRNNAIDVAYAVRRLIRGLASPRESSRLGFAVALTELLSRLDTVTCRQVLSLLSNASQATGSMSGQEERDMLFARLFGLKSIVQSGLLFRQMPLRTSSSSPSSLKAFENILTELLALGEKKSWLKESCWWTLATVADGLYTSQVPWKKEAEDLLFDHIFVGDKSWGPEKAALTLKLQGLYRKRDWRMICTPHFKTADILATGNLASLGRILKESIYEDSKEGDEIKSSAGPWKPQLHFVWDVILDTLLGQEDDGSPAGTFEDFYRIVVDEMLFSSSSSPERKYWGFQIFQKVILRLSPSKIPLLFTKNFMRTWINHLSKTDRYLHKIARQVASIVQEVAEKQPEAGFTLVLQLTGTNGTYHFDRITKTKTVESILANMDSDGIKEYINYLLKQVNEGEQGNSSISVDARRAWIIEQMSTLLRKGSIPKSEECTQILLDWFATHAFFSVVKKSLKSSNFAIHTVPEPPFSESLREICRRKLLVCLGDLSNLPITIDAKDNVKATKVSGTSADGEYWITKVLKTIVALEKDIKHVRPTREPGIETCQAIDDALNVAERLKMSKKAQEAARGVELLIVTLLLTCMCEVGEEAEWETLHDCVEASTELFFRRKEGEKKKKEKIDKPERAPVDIIVDIIIGLLEKGTTFCRIIANQAFSMLTSFATESTVNLVIAQLERRDPSQEEPDEDEELVDEDSEIENLSEVVSEGEEGGESGNEDDTEALRKALEAVVSGNDAAIASDDDSNLSDEVSMDDEQMMQIDEKLAAVFRSRTTERKNGKDIGAQREATYFKNRVLDLVEIFMKRQPSSRLVLLFILPLVDLVSTSSSDEKQLSDKAKGILRSRVAKAKDAPLVSDVSQGVELLEILHQRARRSHSSEIVTTINMCSLFIAKALIATDQKAAIRIYGESISDFITRKSSSLNPSFVTDFIRRYPAQAWDLRALVISEMARAANGYRQTQAIAFVQAILIALPYSDSKREEIYAYLPTVSQALRNAVTDSCSSDKPLMSVAQMKDALKAGMQICRFSKRLGDGPTTLEDLWTPNKWDELAAQLANSEHFKGSPSLVKTCQQISQLIQSPSCPKSKRPLLKRKPDPAEGDPGEGEEPASVHRKRKKVRKTATV